MVCNYQVPSSNLGGGAILYNAEIRGLQTSLQNRISGKNSVSPFIVPFRSVEDDLMILVPFTVPSRCELLRLSRSDCAALLNLDHAKIRVFEQ